MGADGIISRQQSGAVSYYLKNAHGDIVYTLNDSRTKTATYKYSAWGETMDEYDSNTSSPNPIKYSGEYEDSESGMIYLRGRYYDPELRRFITEDPAKDGLNWYAYCGNNPVMYVDPWGLFENGDQYLTPEHVGQILLCTLVYYAGEKLGDQNVKTYAENAAEWYRTNDSKNSYHLGLDILYSYNSEANGAGITQAFFEGLDNMFSFEGDALDTIAQGLLGEVAGTIIASVVSGLQNDVTPKDELYDFWREVQYVQDLSFKNYNTQCSFEIITDADGSYIRMTYYNEDRVKIEKDFMKQTFYAAVANAVEV